MAWLDRNKVFFETVAATALAAMAVIVSGMQIRVANKQTELQELQTKIAEAQALPMFELDGELQRNPGTGIYEGYNLTIANRGGAVTGFDADVAYFLIVQGILPDGTLVKERIPAPEYFDYGVPYPARTGVLEELIGKKNNSFYGAMEHSIDSAATRRRWSSTTLDQELYLKFTYNDLLGRPKEDYYSVPWVGGGTEIPPDSGRAVFAVYAHHHRPQFREMTVNLLLDSVTARIRKR